MLPLLDDDARHPVMIELDRRGQADRSPARDKDRVDSGSLASEACVTGALLYL